MASDLDKMFSDFEARKLREKEAQDEMDAKHKAFRDKAIKIVNERVAPVLRDLCADLKRRGHESEVSLFVDNHSYPSAQLSFRAVNKEPHSYTSASKLSFSTTTSEDKVEIRKEIWGAKGKDESPSYGGQPSFKLLDDVTAEWVKTQVVSFVSTVLSKL